MNEWRVIGLRNNRVSRSKVEDIEEEDEEKEEEVEINEEEEDEEGVEEEEVVEKDEEGGRRGTSRLPNLVRCFSIFGSIQLI